MMEIGRKAKGVFFWGEIQWMENSEVKVRRKTFFLSVFSWMERKENKLWGSGFFLWTHQNIFSQNEEKTEYRRIFPWLTKISIRI